MKYKMYIAGCFVVICFSRSVVKKLMPEGLWLLGLRVVCMYVWGLGSNFDKLSFSSYFLSFEF